LSAVGDGAARDGGETGGYDGTVGGA
jgi:hypothetical protein